MRILIIGGTKFIGPRVVARLVHLGHEVTIYHRGQTEADLPREVRHVHREYAGAPVVKFPEELRNWQPEAVLHTMLIGGPDAHAFVNAFAGIAPRAIAVSSGDVYRAYGVFHGMESGLERVPLTEDSPLRSVLYPYRNYPAASPHAWLGSYDKILAEQAVLLEPRWKATILRLPMVYGPGEGGRLTPYVKRMHAEATRLEFDECQTNWRWTRGFVDNVAAAIALAVADDRASGRVYNLGEPFTLTMLEWIREIAATTGWSGEIVPLPKNQIDPDLRLEANFDQDIWYDTSRIRSELGYAEPIPFREALARTVEFERALNPIVASHRT